MWKNWSAERNSGCTWWQERNKEMKPDFPDETFDAAAGNYVYHNIPSEGRQAILPEIFIRQRLTGKGESR